jgi:TctA family transporter
MRPGDIITTSCATPFYVFSGPRGDSRRMIYPTDSLVFLGSITENEAQAVSDDGSVGWIILSDIVLEPAVAALGSPYSWEH